jgi:surface protein
LSCGINSNVQECLICKDGFDLYNGECIQYAFSAIYNITSSYDYVNIFHHSYSFDLKAVKIDDEIIRWPSSTHRFKDNGINKVYFYLSDYGQISLENFFKYVHALIEFSFNDKYTKNFTISTMRGMFEYCSSLKSVSFNQFNSNYLDDIAYLFLDCISLQSISFSGFNPNDIRYMEGLFYNCISLNSIDLSHLFTKNVRNKSSMLYNCYSLNFSNIYEFNTTNVVDKFR